MTETLDQLIQARFDAVANRSDDSDWDNVLERVRGGDGIRSRPPARSTVYLRRMPRRIAVTAAAVALAAIATAVAFGWPPSLIDFFTSPPAPAHVKNWFGALSVAAPKGMNPQAIPGQARKIATASFDAGHLHGNHPTVHTLYVAPRKGGGFCYLWTNGGGGCLPAKPPSADKAMRTMGPLGLDWYQAPTGPGYVLLVSGWVLRGATRTVEARFADGTRATIPVTWVSAPVNAGFLIYPVPPAHRTRLAALTSVVALDANGSVIGRQTFRLAKRLDQDVMQTLPDGTKYSLPRRAVAARARKIISFRTTTGSRAYVWVMPRKGGGLCFLSKRMQGCPSSYWLARLPVFNGGLSGSTNPPLLFFGQAKPEVATIELRYQNGDSERLTPIDGFVLTEIKPTHYALGKRLAAVVTLDQHDKAISTQHYQPKNAGTYPCKKPINQGYGVKECP